MWGTGVESDGRHTRIPQKAHDARYSVHWRYSYKSTNTDTGGAAAAAATGAVGASEDATATASATRDATGIPHSFYHLIYILPPKFAAQIYYIDAADVGDGLPSLNFGGRRRQSTHSGSATRGGGWREAGAGGDLEQQLLEVREKEDAIDEDLDAIAAGTHLAVVKITSRKKLYQVTQYRTFELHFRGRYFVSLAPECSTLSYCAGEPLGVLTVLVMLLTC